VCYVSSPCGQKSLPPASWAVCPHSKPDGRLKPACSLPVGPALSQRVVNGAQKAARHAVHRGTISNECANERVLVPQIIFVCPYRYILLRVRRTCQGVPWQAAKVHFTKSHTPMNAGGGHLHPLGYCHPWSVP